MFDTDKPITKAADDLLNRATFAEHLAQTLINYSVPEGFVIGLYGKWGSGKTSVLNMIVEQIEKNKKDSSENAPIILRFNPWLCSDPNQLISQFFKQLSSEMKLKAQILENVCKFINNYAGVFELAKAVPFPYIGDLLANAGKIVNEKAKDYMELRNNDLQQLKNKISKELLDNKIKIIVTIDDIDRLSNEEIVSVFQLVKSLADFPYTIYLLSFDRDIVVRALAEVQKYDGAEYLEKVVQVPFELPAYDKTSIRHIFFNKMDAILKDGPHEQKNENDWPTLFNNGLKYYLSSVRDVIRFVNTFALKYELLKNETYFIDLIGLTCLQVFEPKVFSRLRLYKDHLCGKPRDISDNNREKEIQTVYNTITEGVSEDKKSIIYGILSSLFPKIGILEKNRYSYQREYNYYKALNNGYASCPDCFDRYFSLMLESNALTLEYVKNLIFDATENELSDGIEELNRNKKIVRFINHIDGFFTENQENIRYSERSKLLFTCLIRQWHKFEEFKNVPFSFDLPGPTLNKITKILLKSIEESERSNIVYKMFKDISVSLSTIAILLNNFTDTYKQSISYDENEHLDQLLTPEDITNLKNIFVDRVISEFEAGSLLDNQKAMLIIISLMETIDPEKAKYIIKQIISSDLSLVKFISAIIENSFSAQGTGIIAYRVWNVNKDNINKYIDVNIAYDRIIKFTNSDEFKSLPHEMLINIGAFLIRMENYEEIKNLYGNITLQNIENRLNKISCYKDESSPCKP